MSSHAGAQADRKVLQERDKEETKRLIRSWKEEGDPASREQIICQHLYLVQAVARKFNGLGESTEDLVSEGMMGLVNAVDLFDPDRGVQFATYATHLIDGHIRHYLRDKSKIIREPAWIQERLTRIARTAEALTHEQGRPATLSQIAKAVNLSEKQVRDALKTQQRGRVASLDTARAKDNEDADYGFDLERLSTSLQGDSKMEVEDRIFLEQAMHRLKPLEQKVLQHFYYLDLNQTEIARKLGISVNYASYLLRGALSKLKQTFEAQSKIRLETGTEDTLERRCRETTALYSLPSESPRASADTAIVSESQFRQLLCQEVLRATRYPQQFAILLAELDGAAQRSEDEVAQAMSALLLRTRKSIRMVDVLSRLGRWRIGLLLPHTGRQATVVAERLLKPLQGFTVSVAVTVFPFDGSDEGSLERHLLHSLQAAQTSGGNQICRADAVPVQTAKPKRRAKRTSARQTRKPRKPKDA